MLNPRRLTLLSAGNQIEAIDYHRLTLPGLYCVFIHLVGVTTKSHQIHAKARSLFESGLCSLKKQSAYK
jgi:hypothetical protein